MNNPFESGHIKNYVLLYVSIVIIMILFFIASTLFHDVVKVDKKVFNSEINVSKTLGKGTKIQESKTLKFKLLDKSY